jgi:thioredoxin family protein
MTAQAKPTWEGLGLEVLRTPDFEGQKLRRLGTYAVCFAASWCHPTRQFVPKFAARKGTLPMTMAIADITSIDDPLWDRFQIKITPTVVVFRDGAGVGRMDGRWVMGLRSADLDRLAGLIAEPPPRGPGGADGSVSR